MKIKRLGIIILIISIIISCSNNEPNNNGITITFIMNDNTEITSNLYLCKYNNNKYFGIPNEIEKKIQPGKIYESIVKIDNKIFLKAKPVGILESDFPNTEAMFFISYGKKKLSGIGRFNDKYWFIVDNNINNNNKLDSLFNFIKNEKCLIGKKLQKSINDSLKNNVR